MWAALSGHIEIMEMLYEEHAALDAVDSLGATALILSVQHTRSLSLVWLLDRGAKPEIGESFRWTPCGANLQVLPCCFKLHNTNTAYQLAT